jgi:hypothetical protein
MALTSVMERMMKTKVYDITERRIRLAIQKHVKELNRLILMLKIYEKQRK